MLSSRLPTELIARLLLALVLVCNLTLCISWHGAATAEMAMATDTLVMTDAAEMSSAMQGLPCHDAGNGMTGASMSQGDCQMHGGLTSQGGMGIPLLAALLTLFALPLLLMPRPGAAASLLDQWLRDPLLRLRGTHPPSWPRRHLMLSVLRH
ncbi:hypothetical protein [Aeromonas sp. sif2416]|uniref:hypothetical protein n=1 Tax=Aeromonas sp. sif2416 TaxID=2854793 RepID=UPI001C43FA60|nr:hypothetical protein [Aeromonas sp. sif2416]MBV7436763.1 hypothetical protein [Aeromonas sp. sif2416]